MNALCAICQDILVPSNDIFLTPCGHCFHFPCLIRWLEKSLSCPECRQKVKRENITRIYFNFTTEQDVKEDSVSLQQKVDSLTFQVQLKDAEHKNIIKENLSLKKQLNGVRDELKKAESDITSSKAVIRGLKDESLYLRDKSQKYEDLKKEKEKLENQINQYEKVKSLICESEKYVTDMMADIHDRNDLVLWCTILKKQCTESVNKRKELRETIRKLQQELQELKMKRSNCTNDLKKEINDLQEALAVSEREKELLKKKLANLEGKTKTTSEVVNIESTENSENAVSRKRFIDYEVDLEIVSPKKIKQIMSLSRDDSSDSILLLSPKTITKPKENEEFSRTSKKLKNTLSLKDRVSSSRSGFLTKNILPNKKAGSNLKGNKERDQTTEFDGFGGHSRIEEFPKTSVNVLKRSNNESVKSKKIKLDRGIHKPMDDFVINLT